MAVIAGSSSSMIPDSRKLKPNTIGPLGLAALAIGICSPALGIYALWAPMQATAGPITPLVFLAAMFITLPTAISYALLNREMPSMAGASGWLWTAVHPIAGFQAGLLMMTYFFMSAAAQPLMFALFFRDLLSILKIDSPLPTTMIAGILLSSAPVAWACLRGTEASIKSTVRLMVCESLVLVALSITIVASKAAVPGAVNLSSFDPRFGTSLSGFWAAMILGVLAFCGFDVVSTAAEEARAPREILPKAIVYTVVGIGIFWALNAWAFTLAAPPEQVVLYTNEGLTAVTPIARSYWGWGNMTVILTAFSGQTAIYISSMQGTSRIMFALARRGLLPRALARLEGEKRVPKNAVLSLLALVIALDLISFYLLKNGLDAFTWWANALVFFAVLTFLAVNIANPLFFWRCARPRFGIVGNLLIPTTGAFLNAYLLYSAFFSSLWSAGWRTGKSVVLVCLVLLALQLTSSLCIYLVKPELLRKER
jgi:putrescine importer